MVSQIPVKTTIYNNNSQQSCNQLNAYKAAKSKLNQNNIFLLESLSGPQRDCKMSILGLDAIFNIKVYFEKIELSGNQKVIKYLISNLAEQGFKITGNNILYDSSSQMWQILNLIKGLFAVDKKQSFSLSYFGYFTYDTVRFIENIPNIITKGYDYPVIAFTVHQTLLIYHNDGKLQIVINNSDLWEKKTIDDYESVLSPENNNFDLQGSYPADYEVFNLIDKQKYLRNVDIALEHIRMGDIYQIQIGHQISIKSKVEPFTVYQTLRNSNPSPYMFLADIEGLDLIGASPELYVGLNEKEVVMRPIAGTIGKKAGISKEELTRQMLASEKERAEHIMLVDLCRNDLSRICQTGSLEVDELMTAEEYSHLFHIVSNVKVLIDKNYDAFDIIKATFPAGTMTGAPKVRAMEIIESLESSRRGIYAGAVGLIGFNNSINTALSIRCAYHQNGIYNIRASAGVVSDSEAEKEWMETLYKMSSIYFAITKKELINESFFN